MQEILTDIKLQRKELALQSLLEITQAINENLPEEHLYSIYHFTLRGNLSVSKLALYVNEEQFDCKINFGTNIDFKQVSLPLEYLTCIKEVMYLESMPTEHIFQEFDIVIPVFHKDTTLAYVFIGGLQADAEKTTVDTTFIQTLTNIIIVALENRKLHRKQLEQEAFNKELEIAQRVQALLFPKDTPHNCPIQIKATYLPHRSIGGDYYDFIEISPDEYLMCIADVSGKGIPAALLMANFQASLRTVVRQTNSLKEIVEELNFLIYNNARGEHFITFFISIYNQKDKTFRYINAGHNPSFFTHNDQACEILEKGTTVLGFFHPLPFIEEAVYQDVHSFSLFAYTDGLVETMNEEEDMFGMKRIQDILRKNCDNTLEILHENIVQELNDFKATNLYLDDITLLACQLKKC